MRYLGINEILEIGKQWHDLVQVIGDATLLIHQEDFAQPVKPYLRYRDKTNRIIAMPAFVGGQFSLAGIKWIASFPANIDRGLDRAHAVTILNEADSGVPLSLINTNLISAIRTAAVSGYFIREMHRRRRPGANLKVGITGFGIIGQMHLEMIFALLGESIAEVSIYDIRPVPAAKLPVHPGATVQVVPTWEAAYQDADIFITCTVSKERYIHLPPKEGSLQLNVSLRDYQPQLRPYMQHVVVDNWEEICRENTDIEKMFIDGVLQEQDTISLPQLAGTDALSSIGGSDVIMFNPMGMAVYDVAIASHYYRQSLEKGVGIQLQ